MGRLVTSRPSTDYQTIGQRRSRAGRCPGLSRCVQPAPTQSGPTIDCCSFCNCTSLSGSANINWVASCPRDRKDHAPLPVS